MTVKEVTTRRGAESEQAILDAARDILADRGIEGLSMRSVGERVGVSATALLPHHLVDIENACYLKRDMVTAFNCGKPAPIINGILKTQPSNVMHGHTSRKGYRYWSDPDDTGCHSRDQDTSLHRTIIIPLYLKPTGPPRRS